MSRSMPLKNLRLVGAHRASGYTANIQVHEYHLKQRMKCTCLKCCDEESGKCASNPMSRQGEEVHALKESVFGWCPSSVWVHSQLRSSRLLSETKDYMYISLRCCDEETGKCASNPMSRHCEDVQGLEKSVVGWCPSLDMYMLVHAVQ